MAKKKQLPESVSGNESPVRVLTKQEFALTKVEDALDALHGETGHASVVAMDKLEKARKVLILGCLTCV